MLRYLALIFCYLFLISCDDQSNVSNLELGDGPQVIAELPSSINLEFDWQAELSFPLPNDALFSQRESTWRLLDELNASDQLRAWADDVTLLGGAPLTPLISVPFSQSIELEPLLARQRSETLLDDAIYLICISEGCMGELIPLDFGEPQVNFGLFSELNALAESEGAPSPDHLTALSLPLPPALNLDTGSSSSSFGGEQLQELAAVIQDINGVTPSSLIWSQEQQTSGQHFLTPATSLGDEATVLSFKPAKSLRPKSKYAVVLTRALSSRLGSLETSVKGDTRLINQDESLVRSALIDALKLSAAEIAISWSFTTGDPKNLYRSLRALLTYDTPIDHPLSERVASLSLGLREAHHWTNNESISACESRGGQDCRADTEQLALLTTGVRGLAIAWAETKNQVSFGERLSAEQKSALYESYRSVRGLFSGVLEGWTVTRWTGTNNGDGLTLGSRARPFWCIIPESGDWIDNELSQRRRQAPYPVLVWSTDSTRERLDLLLHAGYFARAGFASCAIETIRTTTPPDTHDRLLSEFALNLSLQWRDEPWSSALAMSYLRPKPYRPSLRSDDDSKRLRPLNRSLALQQLTRWLGHGDEGNMPLRGDELSILRNLISLPGQKHNPSSSQLELDQEFSTGALVYGGEGEGATSALLSVLMDTEATGVTTVDAVSDYLKHSVVGIGRGGADVMFNRHLNARFVWNGTAGDGNGDKQTWHWVPDSLGQAPVTLLSSDLASANLEERLRALDEQVDTELKWSGELISKELLEGKWVALYNQSAGILGEQKKFSVGEHLSLGVRANRGDLLSMFAFAQEGDQTPILMSEQLLIAPYQSLDVLPSTEGMRRLWRLSQWRDALDDPGAQNISDINTRALLIAHPRNEYTPLSSSLSISKMLGIFSEDPRQDLYGLDEERFLRLSQAFEPQRAWGAAWMDWDDLDLLESSEPSFTRNTQVAVGKSTFLGGYHALRMPWRSSSAAGLSLPGSKTEVLSTITTNLINRFLNGLSHNASIEALNDMCLNYLAPSAQACSFLSVTSRDDVQ